MNNTTPFIRKIIYIACIGGLLIPLSMVSRPETRNKDGEIQDPGGILSTLRDEHDLSQAKMSEIDPASETMKLASLGLRGVAVNVLWMQAMEHKKTENYDQLASTLQTLTKIQPNFVKVWEYQAHNLAYNVSMEFDDYEYRYGWVKKGLAFLKQGIPYNKRDHRVPSKLGFFTGNKMGKSDEKVSFRRMFRKDTDFYRENSDFVDPDEYNLGYDFGHDSWKLAYEWYDISRKMVEEQSCPQRETDILFYMYRPSQLRNMGLSLQTEFRSDEVLEEIWRRAAEEWKEYGKQEISNSLGITISLDKDAIYESDIEAQQRILDELVGPNVRVELTNELMKQAELTESQRLIIKMNPDERTDEQNQMVRDINSFLSSINGNIDEAVALEAPEDKVTEVDKIIMKIAVLRQQVSTIGKNSDTVNYRYWKARNRAESTQTTIDARKALYDAEQMWAQSIYDDEYDFDYKTKQKTVTKKGAISLYLNAFALWSEVFEEYPELKDGVMSDDIKDFILRYREMLNVTNREWLADFPLQGFLDYRYQLGKTDDGLPTSEGLDELISGRNPLGNRPMDGDEIGARPKIGDQRVFGKDGRPKMLNTDGTFRDDEPEDPKTDGKSGDGKSKTDKSKTDKSETDKSETDKSETDKDLKRSKSDEDQG